MRLAILDHGHGIRTKAMFALIRVFSGHPVVDAVKLALYRPSFYRAGGLTQEAMRGPSEWSVADRELMAAYVSKVNETQFCIAAHTAEPDEPRRIDRSPAFMGAAASVALTPRGALSAQSTAYAAPSYSLLTNGIARRPISGTTAKRSLE